ncbi:hypothetical protein, partial [Pseudomonas syringae group genomosp. 7]|uniref:hypothetical protein n=1 Tax=Pseudomonas syringae group genomosp. 7 TaxID=251699 RepID=UPI00376FA641
VVGCVIGVGFEGVFGLVLLVLVVGVVGGVVVLRAWVDVFVFGSSLNWYACFLVLVVLVGGQRPVRQSSAWLTLPRSSSK